MKKLEDEKIIELFFKRSENAITELSQKYGQLCMTVSMNILGNNEDAEECVNDSYFGVWNAIPPHKPDNLTAFLCKIVRNLSLKRCSRNSAEKRKSNYGVCIDELDECLLSANTVESELEFGELSGTLDKFIAQLDKTNQFLFVRRYWFMDSYESLSKSTGIKEQAIRTRLSRIRSNLKKFLAEQEVI